MSRLGPRPPGTGTRSPNSSAAWGRPCSGCAAGCSPPFPGRNFSLSTRGRAGSFVPPFFMAFLNDHYLKLRAGYLFPEIARRVNAFCALRQSNPVANVFWTSMPIPTPIKTLNETTARTDKATAATAGPPVGPGAMALTTLTQQIDAMPNTIPTIKAVMSFADMTRERRGS